RRKRRTWKLQGEWAAAVALRDEGRNNGTTNKWPQCKGPRPLQPQARLKRINATRRTIDTSLDDYRRPRRQPAPGRGAGIGVAPGRAAAPATATACAVALAGAALAARR